MGHGDLKEARPKQVQSLLRRFLLMQGSCHGCITWELGLSLTCANSPNACVANLAISLFLPHSLPLFPVAEGVHLPSNKGNWLSFENFVYFQLL